MSSTNLVGNLPYYSSYNDWKTFTDRLEQYCIANDIKENVRAALLLTTVEEETYNIIRDLCHPQLPKDKSFNELVELMQKHAEVRTSIFKERVKFHRAEQEENETILDWVERIKKLSIDCKFGYELDIFILEKFISGLRPGAVLDRMCEERPEVFNLIRAMEIAVIIEKGIEKATEKNKQ